ncbi:MAG: CvpA family protein [Peptococcaceae bacterium]|nr:MAG: CvpA family protein [Peptococcaceae bacterium]
MNWLDWAILLVVGFSTMQGLRFGLVASLTRLLGVVVGLVVAANYYWVLTSFLSNRLHLDERIAPVIKEGIQKWLPLKDIGPAGGITNLTAVPVMPGGLTVGGIADLVVQTITTGFLDVVSFLVLFVAVIFLANAIGRILTGVVNLSLLGPINSLGGLVFGLVRGLVMVVIVLALLKPFQLPVSSSGEHFWATKIIQESRFAPYFLPLVPVLKLHLPDIAPVFGEYQKNTER